MKAKLGELDIFNWWLGKFFNTNMADVRKDNPQWKDDSDKDSAEFYEKYAVTKEQMEEFDKYFYKEVPKLLKVTQKYWKRSGWLTYLNTAPSEIITE